MATVAISKQREGKFGVSCLLGFTCNCLHFLTHAVITKLLENRMGRVYRIPEVCNLPTYPETLPQFFSQSCASFWSKDSATCEPAVRVYPQLRAVSKYSDPLQPHVCKQKSCNPKPKGVCNEWGIQIPQSPRPTVSFCEHRKEPWGCIKDGEVPH